MTPEDLYILWLRGDGLRTIAKVAGVSHSTVAARIKKAYGDHATDPVAMSLARSLATDYEDSTHYCDADLLTLAQQLLKDPDTVKHRSKHNLRQLGRYQVVHDPELMDYLAYEEPSEPVDAWGFLRLPFLRLLLDTVRDDLAAIAAPVVSGVATG